MSDLSDAIPTNAAAPKKASGDGWSAEQHPIADQIAAEKFRESRTSSRRSDLGIKFFKLSPPGGDS